MGALLRFCVLSLQIFPRAGLPLHFSQNIYIEASVEVGRTSPVELPGKGGDRSPVYASLRALHAGSSAGRKHCADTCSAAVASDCPQREGSSGSSSSSSGAGLCHQPQSNGHVQRTSCKGSREQPASFEYCWSPHNGHDNGGQQPPVPPYDSLDLCKISRQPADHRERHTAVVSVWMGCRAAHHPRSASLPLCWASGRRRRI